MFSESPRLRPRLLPAVRLPPPPPLAPSAPLWFGAYGGKTSVFIDVPDQAAWTAALSADAAGWLSFAGPAAGTGAGLVTLRTEKSTGGEQTATLTVQLPGGAKPRTWPVRQISTEPLSTLNTSVLQVPFPTVPNVMELGILGKWAAQGIAKVPEPFTGLALALALLVIQLIGALALALRSALSPLVPEPLTWFGAPEPYDALTKLLPATAVFLQEETDLLTLYLPIQVANGGE